MSSRSSPDSLSFTPGHAYGRGSVGETASIGPQLFGSLIARGHFVERGQQTFPLLRVTSFCRSICSGWCPNPSTPQTDLFLLAKVVSGNLTPSRQSLSGAFLSLAGPCRPGGSHGRRLDPDFSLGNDSRPCLFQPCFAPAFDHGGLFAPHLTTVHAHFFSDPYRAGTTH